MLQNTLTGFKTVYRSIPTEQVVHAEDARLRDQLRTRLRAILVLAGSVGNDALAQVAGRARAGLPIRQDQTFAAHWIGHARALAEDLGRDDMDLRLLLSHGHSLSPESPDGVVRVSRREDANAFRGTGGVLRDVANDYQEDDLLLIVSGSQILREPMSNITVKLAQRRLPVALAARKDQTPCDITLATAGALRSISCQGYVDFKEQGLPELARRQAVGVVQCDGHVTLPVRTLGQYIEALRVYHWSSDALGVCDLPADGGTSRFAILEDGVEVERGARLVDSVVLRGARIGAGAVVVRSLIGPGAVVRAGAVVIDSNVAR